MRLTKEFRSQFLLLTTFVLSQGLAHAQDGHSDAPTDEPAQTADHVILGLGAAYTPAYEGADKYRALPLPAVDVQWGPFFVNLRNGIGINILDTQHVTFGTSLMFMQGYRRQDAPAGIGELSNGAGARAFVSFKAAGAIATLGATRDVTGGTKGLVADASLSYPIVVNPRLTLIPTVATTWADAKYSNRYFGVTPEQSLASGLPQFTPGQGIKDASAMLTASFRLTEHLSLGASAGATTLLNHDKDSPIVVHRNAQPTGFLSLSYRFGS